MALPIDESVGLLARYAPEALEELSGAYPDAKDILRPGIVAGEVDKQSRLAAEVTMRACERSSRLATQLAAFLRRRLDASSRLEFLAQLIATLSSGALLGLLTTDVPALARFAAATLAFASSIATLASRYFTRTLTPGSSSAADVFTELLEIKPEAESLLDQSKLWLEAPEAASMEDLQAMVGRGNALSAKLYRLANVVPGFTATALGVR